MVMTRKHILHCQLKIDRAVNPFCSLPILMILLLSTIYLAVHRLLTKPSERCDGLSSDINKSCQRDQQLLWIWTCEDGERRLKVRAISSTNLTVMSQAACKFTCNSRSAIWPRPTNDPTLSKHVVAFKADEISFVQVGSPTAKIDEMLKEAQEIFYDHVLSMESKKMGNSCSSAFTFDHHYKILIKTIVSTNTERLPMDTDESYSLEISSTAESSSRTLIVHIFAPTFFGARHALETLSQLMVWDHLIGSLVIVKEANIGDGPVFSHRGLLVDSTRSFIEIPVMKRIIDGLSYNKMNVLHWHLTDSQSFPFVSERKPLMSLHGAYSPMKVYRPEDIEDLVHYALVRGVKIIPELGGPSRVGAGWDLGPDGEKGEMVLCYGEGPCQSYCAEPPCGILNPVNENVYKVLGNIYKDMGDLFQSDTFHMGGDVVDKFDCWKESGFIDSYMKDHDWDTSRRYHQLWRYFQTRSLAELDKAYASKDRPSVVLWSNELTAGRNFLDPKRYIVQLRRGEIDSNNITKTVIQQGYRLIMSNMDALYLDCGFTSWLGYDGGNNRCSLCKTWQQIYDASPRKMFSMNQLDLPYNKHGHQFLGSEAIVWTEQTDDASIEVKIWPRTSALAERLWSDPSTSWIKALPRLIAQRNRMVERGIAAESVQMENCEQNDCE